MVFLLGDLKSFEEWFYSKLIEEKNRRLIYIKNLWNNLDPKKRDNLVNFIDNNFLLRFRSSILLKSYNELYLVIRDELENSFEIIKRWEKTRFEFN